MHEELEIINDLTKRQSQPCACTACVKMCKTTPCIGTPADIKKIIEAGHRSKLKSTLWMAGMIMGLPPIDMVAPKQLANGHCAFLTNDLCSLHAAGLKPTEGRLTSAHIANNVSRANYMSVTVLTALTWQFESYKNEKKFCRFFTNLNNY